MAKLSDLQLVLLSAGSQRDDGALLPLPPAITATTQRLNTALAGLVKRGLAEKREDVAIITAAGREAIGVNMVETTQPARAPIEAPAAPPTKAPTKVASVLALLQQKQGASLAELVAATGWLPHTTRAALTGLRKKGHDVTKQKVDEVTRYFIAAAA